MAKRFTRLVALPFLLLTVLSISAFSKATAVPPPAPSISGNLTVCTGNSTTITASINPENPAVIFRWYSNLLLGIIYLHEFDGNPYTTGPLVIGADYYVEAYDTITGQTSAPTYFSITVVPANIDVVTATSADLTICSGDSTLFTATSLLGNTVFEWYDALAGGNTLYAGNPYQTGALTITPNIYVSSLNGNGCPSPRVLAIPPVVTPAADVPLVSPPVATVCSGDSTTFTASGLFGSTTFNWYDTISGGSPLASGTTFTPNAVENSGTTNLSTTYYVEAVDSNGCKSVRTPATLVTLPAVDIPTVDPIATNICSGDSVSFTATSLLGAANFNWYDSISGGTLLYTGTTFNSGPITNSGVTTLTYNVYVAVEDSNGCTSVRTPGTALITPALDAATIAPLSQVICSGDSATFTASSLVGGTIFNWYDSLQGGTLLYSGNPFTSSAIVNNGGTNLIYSVYAEVEDTLGCKSVRTAGTAIISPAVDIPSVDPPVATICNGDSATFIATSLLGATSFVWYDSLIGGNQIFIGDTFNTGTISASGPTDVERTYYVSVQDSNGCQSVRIPVTVLIQPSASIPVVTPPVLSICSGTTATFTASTLIGTSVQFYWYDSISGGNLLDSGATFTTDTLFNNDVSSVNYNYYVENVDSTGCRSVRNVGAVIVTPSIQAPIISPPVANICSGQSAQFVVDTLITAGQTVNWYDSLLGNNIIFVGDTFNTGPLVSTGPTDLTRTYYAEIEDSTGCRSLRSTASVAFTPALGAPVLTNPVAIICNGDSAEFTVTALLDSSLSYYWYDSISGGNLLFIGDTFNTGAINSTGPFDVNRTYYVEAVDSAGCRSYRVPATVIINFTTDVPVVTPAVATVCNGSTAQFVASSVLGTASNYYWYDSITAGNLLFIGDTFTTDTIVQTDADDLTRTYYVEVVDSAGCRSLRVPASVVIIPSLSIPIVNPAVTTVCNGGQATFTASHPLDSNLTFYWYNASSGGSLLYVGDTFTTGTLTNNNLVNVTKNYYVEARDSNGCVSPRNIATAVITPSPDAPIVTPPTNLICNNSSTQFVAESLNGVTFNWYDSLLADTPIFVGDTFNTPVLSNNTGTDLIYAFYVESVDSNGCKSIRTLAAAIIRPATEIPIANPPVANVCSGTTTQFIGSTLLDSNVTFSWYDTIVGGQALFVGDTFTTDTLTNSSGTNLQKVYYLELTDSNGCSSIRTPATAIITPGLNTPIVEPSLPVCNGTSATFVATSLLDSTANYYWYDSLNATTPVFVGDTFVTDPLVSTGPNDIYRTFFVETRNNMNCTSARISVVAVIVPSGNIPVVDPPFASICSGTSTTFIASSLTSTDVTFTWYDSIQGGTLIFEGDTFTTPALTNSGTTNLNKNYFVETNDSLGCKSNRVPVLVIISPSVNAPTVDPPVQVICNNDSTMFVATSSQLLTNFRWYDSLFAGNLLFVGDTFNTGKITATSQMNFNKNYFVEAYDSLGCTSIRSSAIVVINTNPDVIALVPVNSNLCQGDSTSITAISALASLDINWYLSPTSDSVIFNGSIYNTGILFDTITYYVSSTQSATGCESVRYPVTINVNPILPLDGPELSCSRLTMDVIRFQWTAINNADEYEVSLDNGTSWQTPSSGATGLFHDVTRTESNEAGVSLIVRAVNNSNNCAQGNGLNSLASFCNYTNEITPDFTPFNSFSPNGDGVNDRWVIGDGIEFYRKNEVTVFNRWGKEVYKINGYNNTTKVFTAEGLDDGAYYYVIRIPEINFEKTGYVMVIR